jgi:molybdopterin molybdotransferase
MATGDELVPPEELPAAGQIRNSNSVQLAALAVEAGAEVHDFGIIPDRPAAMEAAWTRALAESDVVISTGGVSMGDFDLVPEILAAAGFEVQFDRVAIQPGKPIQFATRGQQACFGLSGNPVSSFLQFLLFTSPFLNQLQGSARANTTIAGTLGETLTRRNTGRMGWIPVHLDGDGLVRAVPFHGSAHINAFANAGGLVAFPQGVGELHSGTQVPVRLLDV